MLNENELYSHLFEVSWEVCNKVGGIYEVITSKVLEVQEQFNDNYYLLGPNLKHNPDFEESNDECWISIRQSLTAKGLNCRFGRWNIPGRPKVILVDFATRYNSNQLLHGLWEKYGVDSLSGGYDYIEPVLFSYACGEVISRIWQTQLKPTGHGAIAHFHEWMCGAGILAVKTNAPQIATAFTTHATMLGRALAGSGVDIYHKMGSINSKKEATIHGITAKCSMEQVSAHEADCFTTVSDITANETKVFLHKTVDVVTTNGLDLSIIPDLSQDKVIIPERKKKLLEPIQKFLRTELPDDLKILATSGRYEYHNKGIDVFLESLSRINNALTGSKTKVLALLLVMGGHTGINKAKVSGDPNFKADPNSDIGFITPYNLYDSGHDSILNACKRLGLNNRAEDNVQVVFIPAMLNGKDGFLNMDYFEVLSCCDLSVFPSWYEPWGYTPHEAAAYSVPTITTDLSGFGMWVREFAQNIDISETGVIVVPRHDKHYNEVVLSLEKEIAQFINLTPDELTQRRISARKIAEESTWKHFYPHYLQGYRQACYQANERMLFEEEQQHTRRFTAVSSTTPLLRMITAVAELPPTLSRLRELASNLWWSWQTRARELFIAIDPKLWEKVEHNPVMVIEQADPDKLLELSENYTFMKLYNEVLKEFDEYMAVPIKSFENIDKHHPVAYFCCEFGIHESLPIYSGGLGILAGDHMKAVSDLSLPVIGIGLLYRNGYFRQQINSDGRQVCVYPNNDFSTLPIEPVCDSEGSQIILELEMPNRILYLAVWQVKVGRAMLYLLDTDISKNAEEDRVITARLYEADRDIRIRQEIVLGMGGVRLCHKLGYSPSVYHMNEGHSAFLILELIYKHRFENNMSLEEAMEYITGSCILTTHTPIDAGNERFNTDQMARYFTAWTQKVGMNWNSFLQLGRIEGKDTRIFDMTVLGLHFSNKANAVSWLHGDVSRKMWRDLWRGLALAEVPIDYITNGIHTASFVGDDFRELLDDILGDNWEELCVTDKKWDKIHHISDEMFWNAKKAQKKELLERIKQSIPAFMGKYQIDRSYRMHLEKNLTEDALVIGFARRFAPYKRATLLFADPDRLAHILNHVKKPIVFLFSGKAHPADEHGVQLIQEVIRYSRDERFIGKIFFIEDYNLIISKSLVRGCDVWLNTPRRPLEASGTSGQKVPVNGGINLSISDGWWCEGYEGEQATINGWTIGPVITEKNTGKVDQNDYTDAESLYSLLEEKIIPTFFNKGATGLSKEWIKIAKNSMRSLVAEYSAHRMVNEYMEAEYIPTARRSHILAQNKFELARDNARWYHEIANQFNSVRITDIKLFGINGDTLVCGQEFNVEVSVSCLNISPKNLDVQLVIGSASDDDFINRPEIVHLAAKSEYDDKILYTGTYIARKNGRFAFGIRVLPTKEGIAPVRANPLVLWG